MSEAAGPVSTAARAPRWLMAVLIVSLAANLLVVGSVGAAMWRFHRAPPPEWSPPNLLGYAASLSRDRRREIFEAGEPDRQHLKQLRRELRQARNELTQSIVADPFDAAQFEAAQGRLVAKETEMREATRTLYSELVKRLTPEERRAYGKWREHRHLPPPPPFLDEADGSGQSPRTRQR